MALHEALVRAALDDAGVPPDTVDVLLTVAPRSDPYLVHAVAVAERLGLSPAHCHSYEAGGAGPVLMLRAAHDLLRAGAGRSAVVVAADLPLTGVSREAYVRNLAQVGPVHPEFEVPFGPTVPAMFALVARAYLDAYRLDDEALAAVARHDRAMAAGHPNAHQRGPMSLPAYRDSRMIAEPLRLLDCAPVSDGGGAVVLVADQPAADRRWPAVHLAGSGAGTTGLHLSFASSLTEFAAGVALEGALQAAGRRRADIDLALIYDCFSIAMLVNLEDMGFAARGHGAGVLQDRAAGAAGRLPVNTHGGLLSHGHPARAGGMSNLVEAVIQLRHAAGDRQVEGCATALVHGMAGVFASHAAALLVREEAA
ncbi:MAG: thiolase family protein [Micromonosporaceae bacterium]|nr:thiolase family protein [Micromonosporaceae bacterium]